MKATTLRTLVGVTTPLILTASVQAGFIGISTTSKPNEYGLLVCNVYAEFDRPGEDLCESFVLSSNHSWLIEVIGGTFYNHQFGTDLAPLTSLVTAFPSIAFDSFVTIGVKQVGSNGQPVNDTYLSGFPGVNGTSITDGIWGVTPNKAAADPWNPDFIGGDGGVLIGQFSTADGIAIQGTMLVSVISNGQAIDTVASFFHVPGPGALWLLGALGLIECRRRR